MPTKSKRKPAARRRTNAKIASSLVADVRKAFGISQLELARLTGHSLRSIVNWENGSPPGKAVVQRLRELQRFQKSLACIIRPQAIPRWLDTPNKALDGLKPLEVIERGEIDRLWHMMYVLGTGMPG
jgi:transcriptional regulator with XRE-family HTH domain